MKLPYHEPSLLRHCDEDRLLNCDKKYKFSFAGNFDSSLTNEFTAIPTRSSKEIRHCLGGLNYRGARNEAMNSCNVIKHNL